MTSGAKMIIITSDEDVIREFSSKKLKNTQIIDLDISEQISSNNQHQNQSNLSQLSEQNSNRNEKQDDDKSLKLQKKSIELSCSICGDRAIGFNYDALSCGSCKAFFVRNASRNLETIKCLKDNGQCRVYHSVRPKCKQCRLRRCFQVGMKKELIRNKEKRRRRRRRYLGKYRIISSEFIFNSQSSSQVIDRFPTPMDEGDHQIIEQTTNEIFSNDDFIKIENMQRIFLMIFYVNNDDNRQCYFDENISDQMSAIESWSKYIGQSALDFIRFYRQIPEFENLNNNNRFSLIKTNLFSLYLISKSFSYQSKNDEKQIRFYNLCFQSTEISHSYLHLIHFIIETTKNDPILLSLLLTILIFSHCLTINNDDDDHHHHQIIFNDLLTINHSQSIYTKLLWNYLIKTQGEIEACKQFTRFIQIIMRTQNLCKTIREIFRSQLITLNNVDTVTSLMETLPFIP